MLIPFDSLVAKYNIKDGKILHIGAHECEERPAYAKYGYDDSRVIWIEGNASIVERNRRAIPSVNIHHAIISDQDDQEVNFIVTNNGQSSSILELDEHKKEHSWVYETHRLKVKTTTVDTLFQRNNLNPTEIHFLNIDIQGAELLALKGMSTLLPHIKYAYLEVNIKHLYKDCALMTEIDDFLRPYGFSRQETVMTQHGWGDALYVKN